MSAVQNNGFDRTVRNYQNITIDILCSDREEQRVSIGERYKPSFLTETEMGNLLEEAVGGFIFAVNTDRFQIIYVSDTVKDCLKHNPVSCCCCCCFNLLSLSICCKLRNNLRIFKIFRIRGFFSFLRVQESF